MKIGWTSVRIPGVRNPSTNGPYRFNVRPSDGFVRAAFDGEIELTKSSLLCFWLHSPFSRAMRPDIIYGDFGFPTVALKNSQGSVYRFARGNIKDFFDISIPNQPQRIEIPIGAFAYDRDLKSNVPDNGAFFDQPIVGLYFDFLPHPSEVIDIELDGVSVERLKGSGWDIHSLVVFERTGQAKQLPAFSTETGVLSFALSLSGAGSSLNLQGARLMLSLNRRGKELQNITVQLNNENAYVALALPQVGAYRLDARIVKGGGEIAVGSWSVCRALSAGAGGTILGISDEYEYDRIAAAGGSWDRLPVSLQQTVRTEDGSIRFSAGTDPFPRTVPGAGRFRIIAPFAMPKWLSRVEGPDYYRYAPASLDGYRNLVAWIAEKSMKAGATHYEVWNEASAIGHWNDGISALVDLHRITYATVKEVAPQLLVLGGCTHSWTIEFLRAFFAAGGAEHCDGLAIHGYTYQPEEMLAQFDGLDELIDPELKSRDFKVYITELGFRVPAFSDERQAKYLVLYTIEAASRQSIAAVLWFRYTNPRPETLSGYRQNSSTGYALVGNNNSYCRPSFAAYRFTERLLQQFDEVRASGPATARRYEFYKEGSLEALGAFQSSDKPAFPEGWQKLDHYGGQLEDDAELSFAVSPSVAHLLK